MDPTANLREQTALAAQMIEAYNDPTGNGIDQDDAARLAELVTALDEWIRRGGLIGQSNTATTPYGRHKNLLSAGDDLKNAAERVLNLNSGIPIGLRLDLANAIDEWAKAKDGAVKL